MAKYRGFMNEPGLGIWAAANGGGGGGFMGPRRVAVRSPAPVVPPVTHTIMPVSGNAGRVTLPIYGIPGDIRDITARSQPGEAIVDDPTKVADDMAAEMGVPGIDENGGFPYGDPKAAEKVGTKTGTGNQGLILAAIIAALVLGG